MIRTRLLPLVPLLGLFAQPAPVVAQKIGVFDNILPDGSANGWARDLGNANAPVELELYLDGNPAPLATFATSRKRFDLSGDNRAGYSIKIPDRYLFTLEAKFTIKFANGGPTLNSSSKPTPFQAGLGAIDYVDASGTVHGWALGGANNSTPVELIAYLADEQSLIGTAQPTESRPYYNNIYNVQGNHGFAIEMPSDVIYSQSPNSVVIFAVERGAQRVTKLTAPLQNYAANPIGTCSISAQNSVVGTVSGVSGPITVRVYGDGQKGIGELIASTQASASGSFSIPLPSAWTTGAYHRLHVAAASASAPSLFSEFGSSPLEIGTRDYKLSMVPVQGARDLMALFRGPLDRVDRTLILDSIGFHSGIWRDEPISTYGPNKYPAIPDAFLAADSLIGLSSFERADIEVPALKPWPVINPCTGMQELQWTMEAGDKLLDVDPAAKLSLTFDAPLFSALNTWQCQQHGRSMGDIAMLVSNQIKILRMRYSNVQIGQNDAYPVMSIATIVDYLKTLESLGQKLDFFHLDVDRRRARTAFGSRWELVVAADLQRLSRFCSQRGIKFGPLLWDNLSVSTATSGEYASGAASLRLNPLHFNAVVEWAKLVRTALGTPELVRVQSWHITELTDLSGLRVGFVPDTVPETALPATPVDGSQIELVHRCIKELAPPNAAIQVTAPMTVQASSPFSVTFQIRNTGNTPWRAQRNIRLGYEGGSSPFGAGRIVLPPNTTVNAGGTLSLTAQFTAPATPGMYPFFWRMVQERVCWFGNTDGLMLMVQ